MCLNLLQKSIELEQRYRAECKTIGVHEADVSGDMQNDTFFQSGACKTLGNLLAVFVFKGFEGTID